jgi:hypothetical protein
MRATERGITDRAMCGMDQIRVDSSENALASASSAATVDARQLDQRVPISGDPPQRAFAEAVKGLDLSCQFEVVRGSLSETIASVSRAGDIIVVYEPASPAGSVTLQFQSVIRAALGSSAAVMLVPQRVVPQRVVRQTGAVVSLAKNPYDPSVAAAAAIAQLAKEELIVIEAFKGSGSSGGSNTTAASIRAKRMSVPETQLLNSAGISAAFTRLHERLVVLTRGAFDDTVAAMIASTCRVPVLIIEAAVDGS